MKRIYLLFVSILLAVTGMNAQTLLNEDFEEYPVRDTTYYSKQLPAGWEVINSSSPNTSDYYNWAVEVYHGTYSSMSGHAWLYVDGPTYSGDPKGGFGPREEKLISPALTLDNTYQLSFDWKAAAVAVLEYGEYTFQVRVIDGADTTTIFDIQNEQQVRNSGVPADPYGTYIWGNWQIHNSKIDLRAYRGKTVKIAFVYKVLKTTSNSFWLDDIKVEQGTSATTPVPQSSLTQYAFPTMYIGEKHYSESFTIRNVGAGNLHVTGFEAPEGMTLTGDTTVSAKPTEALSFQLGYKASLTSPATGTAVIKTNGGDVSIPYTVTKQAVPDGYTLELFEKFPPAGWTTDDGWSSTYMALEGDNSAYSSAGFEDMYLVSPRLDLSNPSSPHKLTFTYYNMFEDEDGTSYAGNDQSVWVSIDGGNTWNRNDSIWGTVYSNLDQYNTQQTVTLDLSKYTSDNVKVRWKNSATPYNSETGADPYSTFILDKVLLPNVYGEGGLPIGVGYITPADSTVNVMNKNVKFSWKAAQFADSYKLYVGTSATNFDVINGQNVGAATEYTATSLPAGTQLYWKVAGVNSVGEENDSPVWTFTTQADNTVTSFPWFEGFENNGNLPIGWYTEDASQYARWSASSYFPYDGSYSFAANGRETGDVLRLYSPDVKLPADGKYQVSFWWGNDNGVNLKRDDLSVRTNQFANTDNGADYGTFEILADGQWTQLDRISDTSDDDNKYWLRDAFDLSAYAGKTVQFRWTYNVTNYMRSNALSLDNVEVRNTNDNSVAFNTTNWFAGKVNYGESFESDTMAVANLGGSDLTVSSVSFNTSDYTSSVKAGDVIAAGSSKPFTVTFLAQNAAADSVSVADEMKINFTNGSSAVLPVSAVAMPRDILFYGFEKDKTGGVPAHFTGINADGTSTASLIYWTTPNLSGGAPLSFTVLNDAECYNSLEGAWGHQALMTRCNSNDAADDWLVSEQLSLTANSKIEFDARCWESVNSILPIDAPTFRVLVSETSATDRRTFTQVGRDMNPGLYNGKTWTHYSVSLSAYAGKNVYVAIEAVYTNSLGGFLDNVEFDHIDTTTGINGIHSDAESLSNKPLYNLGGSRVGQNWHGVTVQKGRKFIKK